MAKFKPPGSRKAKASAKDSKRGLIPCLFLVLMAIAGVTWLFYGLLTSGK
jgi:uncharacterized protein with PQ loop repeat